MSRIEAPCFYCGGIASELDHMPIPQRHGGTDTVPACTSCHDMKDRFTFGSWPVGFIDAVTSDFPNMRRETRIFLAKSLAIVMDATQQVKP